MIVRPAAADDRAALAAMRRALWPDEDPAELDADLPDLLSGPPDHLVLIAERDGAPIGFIEAGIRSYAEGGPAGPSAYVEGIWVEPGHRRRGVASTLLAGAQDWAKAKGLTHLGSDALLDNALSHAWHRAAGFAEVERLVVFGKPLF